MASKVLITIATLMYAVLGILADANPTHLLNPEWTPHARLHMAWLLGTFFSLGILSLVVLWKFDQVLLSALIGLGIAAGFWISIATLNLYGGSLADPGSPDTSVFGIEGNVLSILIITALLIAGIVLKDRSHTGAQ